MTKIRIIFGGGHHDPVTSKLHNARTGVLRDEYGAANFRWKKSKRNTY